MPEENYFPLFISLQNKKILVIGGGNIATRRITVLLGFYADIKVVAPDCTMEILELARHNQIRLEQRNYSQGEIEDSFLVLVATNDPIRNEDIYRECKEKGILVNVASDHTKCDFYFPAIIQKDSLVIGVTASGTDHKKVKAVTEQIRNIM